ncbi:MAG TPA: DUF3618 domain-containing protein [Thermoanaerobaculia bacterium]|nr:DUF3618 domain-containing protein [Thermoanaerobaculia bacterium]
MSDDRAIDRPRDDRSVAEIRHEIQRTRADLDATVDALGRRLRPRNLLWRARQRVEPEAREAGRRVGDRVSDNKRGLATAAGVVAGLWLLRKAAQRRGRKKESGFPTEQKGV